MLHFLQLSASLSCWPIGCTTPPWGQWPSGHFPTSTPWPQVLRLEEKTTCVLVSGEKSFVPKITCRYIPDHPCMVWVLKHHITLSVSQLSHLYVVYTGISNEIERSRYHHWSIYIIISYICPYLKNWGKTAHGRSIFIFICILYIYRNIYIYIYQIYLANSQTKTLSRCSWFRKTTTVFNPNRAAWRTGPREYHGKGMWRPNACGVAAVHDAGFPPKMVHFVDDEKEGFEHVWMVVLESLKGRIEVFQPSPQLRICEILINQCMNSQINLPLCG